MIDRDYKTPCYELELTWDDEGDAEFQLIMTDENKIGLHKSNYSCSYIAETKDEALSKEGELLKIYYDYCINQISHFSKGFKDTKRH